MSSRRRSATFRRLCLERDSHRCVKCGETAGLEAHHIQALGDDGSDDHRNGATLCGDCHSEWHLLEGWMPALAPDTSPFAAWLTAPSLKVLLAVWFRFEWPAGQSASEFRAMVERINDTTKTKAFRSRVGGMRRLQREIERFSQETN